MGREHLANLEAAAAVVDSAPAQEAALERLQEAVAEAVAHGESFRAVARAAHTTPLAVLDALESAEASKPPPAKV
jgi:parvulin-like peptidyl-prolyl isomerase